MWKYLLISFIFFLVLGVIVYAVIYHYGNKSNRHHNTHINTHSNNKHKNPTTTSTSISIEEQEYNNEMRRKRFYEYKASPLSYVYNVDLEKVKSQKDKFYWK